MTRLKRIIEDTDTKGGRRFDITIQSLIVISLAAFPFETLRGLTPTQQAVFDWIDYITVTIFTVEYLLQVLVATSRSRFVFCFFGLVDLVAIAPTLIFLLPFISFGLDLRIVRALRLLRLVRILKLARYSAAVRRFRKAFSIAKEELFLFLFVSAILLYLSGVGIYYFEREAQPEKFQSAFDGLWWAVGTLTTVVFGDEGPITTGGRLFTFFVLVIGLGIVAIPTGLIASALGKARDLENEQI